MKQIYFLRQVGTVGPIKIGCTGAIDDRVKQLRCDMRMDLEVLALVDGGYCAEGALHRQFAHLRAVVCPASETSRKAPAPGRTEWFDASPELLALIEGVRQSGVLPPPPEGDRIAQMKSAYVDGQTLQEIGDRFGITRERVRQLLRRHGVPSEGRRLSCVSARDIDRVSALVASGLTVPEIAEIIGDDRQNVRRILRNEGIAVPHGKKRPHKDSVAKARSIASDYLAGIKTIEIATRHGIPQPNIYRFLRIAGVEVARRPRKAA